MSNKFEPLGPDEGYNAPLSIKDQETQDAVNDKFDAITEEILRTPMVSDMIEAALADQDEKPFFIPLGGFGNVNERLDAIEKRQAAYEAVLVEFKERALAAFKHAGFKF
jgi:hypothetical protein